jgi:hypothetical protein
VTTLYACDQFLNRAGRQCARVGHGELLPVR